MTTLRLLLLVRFCMFQRSMITLVRRSFTSSAAAPRVGQLRLWGSNQVRTCMPLLSEIMKSFINAGIIFVQSTFKRQQYGQCGEPVTRKVVEVPQANAAPSLFENVRVQSLSLGDAHGLAITGLAPAFSIFSLES